MLDQLRRDIATRLDELVGEADKLRHALTALSPRQRNGTSTPAPGSSPRTPRRARAHSRTASTAPKRTPAQAKTTTRARSSTPNSRSAKAAAQSSARTAPGATKSAVLAALAGGDAMTATEVATKTGLGAATISTTLSRLAKTGEITKANRGYQAKMPATHASTDNTGTATPK